MTGPATTETAPVAEETKPVGSTEEKPPEQVEQPAETGKPLSRLEARRGVQEDLKAKAQPGAEVKEGEPKPGTGAAPGADEAAPKPAAAETKPAGIRVEVDPNHPALGGRKLGAITVQTAEEEQFLRAVMNGTYTRRQEVEALSRENAALRRERADFQRQAIERETQQTAREQWQGTPEYKQAREKYQELLDQFGQDVADQYWRGAELAYHKIAKDAFDERMSQAEAEEDARAAEAWAAAAHDRTETYVNPVIRELPNFDKWFQAALESFNDEIARGHYPEDMTVDEMHRQFARSLTARLLREPDVNEVLTKTRKQQQDAEQAAAQAAADKERERKAIEDAAIERYKKEGAARRREAPPHPLGALAGASRDRAPVEASPDEDLSKLSPNELRRRMREGARQDARRIAGQP